MSNRLFGQRQLRDRLAERTLPGPNFLQGDLRIDTGRLAFQLRAGNNLAGLVEEILDQGFVFLAQLADLRC